uniref:Uncharacterized protein n=1 Tax=Panagrolaimus sp. PS1159 TaxID=55785 RepID=A0AC35G7M7_9BILA
MNNNDNNFNTGKIYFSAPRPRNRITESREHPIFSKTLPASRSEEAKSLKELLDRQQAGIAKASSQPSLLEMIEESKVCFEIVGL